jgi:hypothetical protein
MKKLRFNLSVFILFSLISTIVNAQVPQGINYQAVARNSSGIILSNQIVGIEITITNGNGGNQLYTERHTSTTNQFGLFSLNIGSGTVVFGSFSSINWGGISAWMSVSMDASGGNNFVLMGSSQLLSVPYALNAASSLDNKWTVNGNEIYCNNSGNVGIGVATPDQKLHVMGNIKMEDGNEGY